MLLHSESAVPPVNTGWSHHPAAWALLSNRLGHCLLARLVITLGGCSKLEARQPLPGAALVVHFAPQLQLLQRAPLTITDAGLNAMQVSLRCEVPGWRSRSPTISPV